MGYIVKAPLVAIHDRKGVAVYLSAKAPVEGDFDPDRLAQLAQEGYLEKAAAKEPAAAEFVASADELPAKSAKKDHWEATARLLGVSDEDLDGLDKAGVIEATTKAFEARQGRTD